MYKDKGRVYEGEWDLSKYKFSDLSVYKAFKERIEYNKKWEETSFYKETLNQIKSGKKLWGCESREDLIKRFNYLDLLIQKIKNQGYLKNDDVMLIDGHKGNFLYEKMSGEVTVNIGRNGQFLFQDGRHRLAIAKILGIKVIPVKVLVRHKKWQDLREKIISMAEGGRGATRKKGLLYQPAIHPDLTDIPAEHSCEDRFFAIEKKLDKISGKVLDVGANLCYFGHKFEELGFMYYGIENNHEIAKLSNKIRIAEEKNFRIIIGDVFDSNIQNQIKGIEFDILLALNIFHHFLKLEVIFNKFKQWLNNCKVKVIFFEPHLYDEIQMRDSYINFKENEFVRFIQSHTDLNNHEVIYEAIDGRHVYKLY